MWEKRKERKLVSYKYHIWKIAIIIRTNKRDKNILSLWMNEMNVNKIEEPEQRRVYYNNHWKNGGWWKNKERFRMMIMTATTKQHLQNQMQVIMMIILEFYSWKKNSLVYQKWIFLLLLFLLCPEN